MVQSKGKRMTTTHDAWRITIEEISNVDGPHWKSIATDGRRSFTQYRACAKHSQDDALRCVVEEITRRDHPDFENAVAVRQMLWRRTGLDDPDSIQSRYAELASREMTGDFRHRDRKSIR